MQWKILFYFRFQYKKKIVNKFLLYEIELKKMRNEINEAKKEI